MASIPPLNAVIESLLSEEEYLRFLNDARRICMEYDPATLATRADDSTGAGFAGNSDHLEELGERSSRPRQINNFEIIEQIGRGGMGEVYLARHGKFEDRRYAIKLLKRKLLEGDALSSGELDMALKRFENEVKAIGKLQHPNIAEAIDAGDIDGEPYLVMEYVDGCDTQQIKKVAGRLTVADSCQIVRDAAIGLQHAHQQKFVHRDVKPSNLMINRHGTLKILDLGLAKLHQDSLTRGLTGEGMILGTPDYMSPEQWEDTHRVTIQSDIYSLGCCLYCFLTGDPPFGNKKAKSAVEKMRMHVSKTPDHISQSRPDIPRSLAKIVHKCLAKDPSKRYLIPGELAHELEPFCEGSDLRQLVQKHITNPMPKDSIGTAWSDPSEPDLTPAASNDSQRTKKRMWAAVGLFGASIATILIAAVLFAVFSEPFRSQSGSSGQTSPPSADANRREDRGGEGIIGAEPRSTSGASSTVELMAFRLTANQINLGEINGDTADGRVVYENERSRIEISFPEPRYFLVFGMTPRLDEGKLIHIWPAEVSKSSQAWDGFVLAKRLNPADRRLKFKDQARVAVFDGTWHFTDGSGLHSFIVISSSEPLSRFEVVKQRLVAIPWPSGDATPRHWKIVDGRAFVEEFTTGELRGVNETDGLDLQDFVDELKAVFPSASIDGIVFNVEPSY